MNTFNFTGRLGRDSQLKAVGDTNVLNFTVANDVGWGDKKKTEWIECALWGTRGEKIAQYLTKGQLVGVSGEVTSRGFPRNDGTPGACLEVRVNNVDLLGSRDENSQAPPAADGGFPSASSDGDPNSPAANSLNENFGGGKAGDGLSDDVPF